MKRLLNVLVVVSLLVSLLMCFTTVAHAADTFVSRMDVNVSIDKYGNADTTITVDVDFGNGGNTVQFPVGSNASNVSVSGGNFSRKTSDGVTWLVLRHSETITGSHTYVISYRQVRVVSILSDKTQQLDLELLCPYWSWRIDSMTFTVNFPKELDSIIYYNSGYYGDGISIRDSKTSLTVTGEVLSSLMDQESIHLKTALPQGYCTVLHRQGTLNNVTGFLILALCAALTAYWYLQLRNKFPGLEDRKVPPDSVGAWEFPYVASCGKPDLTLLVFEWANLGYLTIRENERGRVTLRKKMDMSKERRAHEVRLFNMLFESGNTCAADTTNFRRIAEKAAAMDSDYWNPRLFLSESGNPEFLHLGVALVMGISWLRCADWIVPNWSARILLILPMVLFGFIAGLIIQRSFQTFLRKEYKKSIPGMIALALSILLLKNNGKAAISLLAIAVQFLSAGFTYRGGRRSEIGMKAIAQIRSFRRELISANTRQLQLMLSSDPQYYYKMLPYAEVLGLGRRFSSNFENIRIERCLWYENEKAVYLTADEFYSNFAETLHQMRRSRRRLFSRLRRRG